MRGLALSGLAVVLLIAISTTGCDSGAGLPSESGAEGDAVSSLRAKDLEGTTGVDGTGHGVAACCFPDGTCQDLEPMDCMNAGGHSQGMGTTCATTTCQMPGQTVACCFSDGTCQDLEPMDCMMNAGGNPQGMGTSCATADCTGGGGHHHGHQHPSAHHHGSEKD